MQAQVCWQCGSMLQAGTVVCPVCGVQQREQAAPVDMHGGYPGYAGPQPGYQPAMLAVAPAQQAPAPQPAPSPAYGSVSSNSQSAPPSSGRSAQRITSLYALGEAFVGTPAGVGTRILSLLIDLVVIAAVGVGAWLLSSSWVLGVVAGLEVAIIFTVMQARTGASLGKLVTRTRVSRADTPRSPGLLRAGVRSAITGAGALVAAVGAVIVELTAAADSTGKRRTIADRAARTVVVSIPTEQARIEAEEVAQEAAHSEYLATLSESGTELSAVAPAPQAMASADAVASLPVVQPERVEPAPSMPQLTPSAPLSPVTPEPVSPAVAPAPVTAERSVPEAQPSATPDLADDGLAPGPRRRSATDPSIAAELVPEPIAPGPEAAAPGPLRTPPPAYPPAPSGSPASSASPEVPAEQSRRTRRSSYVDNGGTVLTFDTGQRESVAAYSVVALGRAPSATGGEDQLIVVTDTSTTISKNHARWEEDSAGVWVTDLGSTNGTELIFADGRTQVLTPGVRTSAQGVARIRLGDRTFTMSPLNGGSA